MTKLSTKKSVKIMNALFGLAMLAALFSGAILVVYVFSGFNPDYIHFLKWAIPMYVVSTIVLLYNSHNLRW
jgi:hypothetical protein